MGFYGNITNTSKTQFQFDKIYSSRYDMESQARTDGIYAGRYVLVEYDTDLSQDSFYRVFINDNNGQMYNAPDVIAENNKITIGERLEFSDPNKGAVSVVPVEAFVFTADGDDTTRKYTNIVYYKVTGDLYKQNKDNNQLIKGNYKQVTADKTISPDGLESTVSNYTKNYAIDNEKYGAGRGYDSTVWQKAYIDNVEKYIMIAELNSVVPTFGVSADAPTAEPIAPHFDTQSTDLYYKLHWQPAWGMRIAEGKLDEGQQKTTITSIDKNAGKYPSDEEVSYDNVKYYPENNTTETKKVSYNGAIYYNKAGFKDDIHTYYNGDGELKEDKISVKPTGVSHMEYHNHGNDIGVSEQPDIQEISIMLPSLGNALCDIWDKVYGYNPKNENLRYRDIGWKDAENINVNFAGKPVPDKEAQGDERLGGMTRKPETLAGCINMAHDLMGMIITGIPTDLNEEEYQKHLIYYQKDDNNKDIYYRLYKYPKYKPITLNWASPTGKSDQEINTSYQVAVNDALTAEGISTKAEVYLVDTDNGDEDEWVVRKYNKKMIGGKSLAVKNGEFGYKLVQIERFADNFGTINGLILSLRNIIESDNSNTRDKSTVQGTINVLNDIIDCFNDLFPGEFLICDNQGKVSSANWTTEQTFEYDNLGKNSSKKEASGKENQWIELSVDESASDKQIKVIHKLVEEEDHKQDDTETKSDKNNKQCGENLTYPNEIDEETHEKIFTGINNDDNINTLKLYTPIVDNAGHVVGKNTETVTLPYGYKYLETNGRVDEEETDLYTNPIKDDKDNITGYQTDKKNVKSTEKTAKAESTQDKITINPKNKWIQTQITNNANNTNSDAISIAHEVHNIDKDAVQGETNLNELTPEEQTAGQDPNKIKIQDMSFDAAGHITANKAHTYVLPYGFRTVIADNDATANKITIPAITATGQSAIKTQDTITIKGANHWIKVGDKDKIISICHNSPDTDTTNTKTTTEASVTNVTDGTTLSTPDFGQQFNIPQISYDKAGHISGDTSYSIKIPAPSLVANTSGNVITGMDLVSAEGKFTLIGSNVGALKLTGYSKEDITDTEAIKNMDSINTAFGKLQIHIDSTDDNLNTEIAERKAAINKEVTDRNAAITEAIGGLDVNKDTFTPSQTIGSWEETDGKISITPQQIMITNANVDTKAAIDISKINIDDNTIAMSKISGLSSALDEKQPAGKYENEGAAATVQNLLIGATNDSTDTLTLNGLLNRIKALEKEVEGLKGSTGA